MQKRKLRLEIINSVPCTQPWKAMEGSMRERHCSACSKQVLNFEAMTTRQIEESLRKSRGQICARVTFHPDGSLRTLDGGSQAGLAAGFLLAASLALPSTASAQSPANSGTNQTSHFSGRILLPDSSGPLAGAFVALIVDHQIIASTHTNGDGDFQLTVSPGRYDIVFGSNSSNALRIDGYELHSGEQTINSMPLSKRPSTTVTVEANMADSALVGALAADIGRPRFFWYFFEHPIRYFKDLKNHA